MKEEVERDPDQPIITDDDPHIEPRTSQGIRIGSSSEEEILWWFVYDCIICHWRWWEQRLVDVLILECVRSGWSNRAGAQWRCRSSLPSRFGSSGRFQSRICLCNNSFRIFSFYLSPSFIFGIYAVVSKQGSRARFVWSFRTSWFLWIFFFNFEDFGLAVDSFTVILQELVAVIGAEPCPMLVLRAAPLIEATDFEVCVFWVALLADWEVEILAFLWVGTEAERVRVWFWRSTLILIF